MLRTTVKNLGQGGVGLTDQLGPALAQLRAGKQLLLDTSTSPGVGNVSPAVSASAVLADASATTLTITARVGGEWGNKIYVASTRTTNPAGEAVFDLEIVATGLPVPANAFNRTFGDSDVVSASDTITVTRHGKSTGDIVQVDSTGNAPTGLTKLIPYFVIKVDNDTFKLATTAANAKAGTPVNITGAGTGTRRVTDVRREFYSGVSMVDGHRRYVESVVGVAATPISKLVVALDGDSSTSGEVRPVDQVLTAMAGGLNEVALAGITPDDEIVSAVNLTDATRIDPATIVCTNAGKIVSTANIAVTKKVLLTVLPYGT